MAVAVSQQGGGGGAQGGAAAGKALATIAGEVAQEPGATFGASTASVPPGAPLSSAQSNSATTLAPAASVETSAGGFNPAPRRGTGPRLTTAPRKLKSADGAELDFDAGKIATALRLTDSALSFLAFQPTSATQLSVTVPAGLVIGDYHLRVTTARGTNGSSAVTLKVRNRPVVTQPLQTAGGALLKEFLDNALTNFVVTGRNFTGADGILQRHGQLRGHEPHERGEPGHLPGALQRGRQPGLGPQGRGDGL